MHGLILYGTVFMENYMKKAADAFLVGRPYGMRVDFGRKGYVLFNRRMNVLGNEMQGDIGTLPLERFEVEEIPLSGELVERHGDFTDVFFYSDRTNPYAGDVPDFGKLKVYNRYMYPLSVVLCRDL